VDTAVDFRKRVEWSIKLNRHDELRSEIASANAERSELQAEADELRTKIEQWETELKALGFPNPS
jgi:hypothetical protein